MYNSWTVFPWYEMTQIFGILNIRDGFWKQIIIKYCTIILKKSSCRLRKNFNAWDRKNNQIVS